MVFRTDDPEADARWACSRKKAYPTERIAGKVAEGVRRRDPSAPILVAYGCTRCGLWHIGRPLA